MAGRARWWLAGLFGAVLCAGCDPGATLYFLMPEAKEPPEMKQLASDDKEKEVKVVILIYDRLDPRPELAQVDRQLSELLSHQLRDLFEQSKKKVTIVPPRRVDEYRNTNPSRHGPDPAEVGKYFHADYVIYLELNEMSLYERGSNLLLRGQAHISVSLVDLNNPDETPEPREFTCVYPSEGKAQDSGPDMPLVKFRAQFLASIARRLSYYFAPHNKAQKMVDLE
jgi:hypothetical protein